MKLKLERMGVNAHYVYQGVDFWDFDERPYEEVETF